MSKEKDRSFKISKLFDKNGKLVSKKIVMGVNSFLEEHWEKIDLKKQTIELYISQKELLVETQVKKELNRLQRVFQISTSPEVMEILLKKHLDSAHKISQIPYKSFRIYLKDIVGGEDIALKIYSKAKRVYNLAKNKNRKMKK